MYFIAYHILIHNICDLVAIQRIFLFIYAVMVFISSKAHFVNQFLTSIIYIVFPCSNIVESAYTQHMQIYMH
jgi:hypothetical protein